MEFRKLRADEIECRIAQVKNNGISLLLYKNARCDMNILDEVIGQMNWQRDHKDLKGRMYAGIGIFDPQKNEWIWKWDCGAESYTEAEKGEASDSFKRAGFNWGIGRELYTAPFIWVTDANIKEDKGRCTCYDRFEVSVIRYDGNKICNLEIINSKTKKVVYKMGESKPIKDSRVEEAEARQKVLEYVNSTGMSKENIEKICAFYNVKSLNDMNLEQCRDYLDKAEKNGGK